MPRIGGWRRRRQRAALARAVACAGGGQGGVAARASGGGGGARRGAVSDTRQKGEPGAGKGVRPCGGGAPGRDGVGGRRAAAAAHAWAEAEVQAALGRSAGRRTRPPHAWAEAEVQAALGCSAAAAATPRGIRRCGARGGRAIGGPSLGWEVAAASHLRRRPRRRVRRFEGAASSTTARGRGDGGGRGGNARCGAWVAAAHAAADRAAAAEIARRGIGFAEAERRAADSESKAEVKAEAAWIGCARGGKGGTEATSASNKEPGRPRTKYPLARGSLLPQDRPAAHHIY